MQITRAGEYGVLGLLNLARRGAGETVMIEEIGREEDIPASFLGKVFQSLARAGLVRSSRGAGGGFALVRPPEDVTVLEVIEAVEGRIALQRCLDERTGCAHLETCVLCGVFGEAQERLREVFARKTLADLARLQMAPVGVQPTAALAAG